MQYITRDYIINSTLNIKNQEEQIKYLRDLVNNIDYDIEECNENMCDNCPISNQCLTAFNIY